MKIVSLKKVKSLKVEMEGARGAHRQLPIGSSDGAPNFSLRVFTLEPGGYTPYHQHDWEHENYILQGEGFIRRHDGSEATAKKGDYALILPGEKHQFVNTSEKDDLQFICLVPKEYE